MKWNEILQELEAETCFQDEGFDFNGEYIDSLTKIKHNERKRKWNFEIELNKFYEDKIDPQFKENYFDFFEVKGNRKTNKTEEVSNTGINLTNFQFVKTNIRKIPVYEKLEFRGRFYFEYALERKEQFFERIKYLIGLSFPNATYTFKK